MAKAELTHGGFYKHFASKEALAVEACTWALSAAKEEMIKVAEQAPPGKGLHAIAEMYLSMAHRDNAERGCVIAALAGETATLDPHIREVIATGFEWGAEVIAMQLRGTATERRQESRTILATMVGALIAARNIINCADAEELLRGARTSITRGR